MHYNKQLIKQAKKKNTDYITILTASDLFS